MRFFSTDEGRTIAKKRAIRFICLLMSLLVFLSACGGEDEVTTTKKKKKKVIVKRKNDNTSQTDSSSDESSSEDDFYFESDEDEEEEDEGEDLKKEEIKDNSFTKSCVPSQYSKLVWSDEFNGTKLDKTKWLQFDGTDLNDYKHVSIDDEEYLNVKDGALHMYNRHVFDPYDPLKQYVGPHDLYTADTMNYRYGYLEMCAKMPYKNGCWSSWWLKSVTEGNGISEAYDPNAKYMVEVDIFELFGSEDTCTPNVHKWFDWWLDNNHTQLPFKNTYTFDDFENLHNEWHVYGYEWTPTYMAFSVDGKEYYRYNFEWDFDESGDQYPLINAPQYIILGSGMITPHQTSMKGEVDNAALPFEYAIDWMRLYQNPSEANSGIWIK